MHMTKPMGVRISAIGSFGLAEIGEMKVLDSFVVTVLYLLTGWWAMEAEELGSRPCHHTVRARCCLRVASMALRAPPWSVIYHLHRYFSRNHLLSDEAECGCRVFARLSRSASSGSIGLRRPHRTLGIVGVISPFRSLIATHKINAASPTGDKIKHLSSGHLPFAGFEVITVGRFSSDH